MDIENTEKKIFLKMIANTALLHCAINFNSNELVDKIKLNLDNLNKKLENNDNIKSTDYDLIMKDCIEISNIIKDLFKEYKGRQHDENQKI